MSAEPDLADRRARLEHVLSVPPHPHEIPSSQGHDMGVWATETACYRFIADHCPPGARTLETGCGLSTAVFAALGADHVCVTPAQSEVDHLRRYLDDNHLSAARVRFETGSSDEILPGLDVDALDLVFIDGAHGFPMPIIDWFFACAHLRPEGVVVIDDLQLAAVSVLIGVLESQPDWELLHKTSKWAAFSRKSSQPLNNGPWDQPKLKQPRLPRDIARDVLRRFALGNRDRIGRA